MIMLRLIDPFLSKLKPYYLFSFLIITTTFLVIPSYVHIYQLYDLQRQLSQEIINLKNEHISLLNAYKDIESSKDQSFESVIKQKLDRVLTNILGAGNFNTSVTAQNDKNIVAHVTMDPLAITNSSQVMALPDTYKKTYLTNLQQDLQNEISHILRGYEAKVSSSSSYVNFHKASPIISEHFSSNKMIFTYVLVSLGAILCAVLMLGIFVDRFPKKTQSIHSEKLSTYSSSEKTEKPVTVLDIFNKTPLQTLANLLIHEPIRPVALLLSHMHADRVAALIEEWPLEKQKELFNTFQQLHLENSKDLITQSAVTLELTDLCHQATSFREIALLIYEHLRISSQKAVNEYIDEVS